MSVYIIRTQKGSVFFLVSLKLAFHTDFLPTNFLGGKIVSFNKIEKNLDVGFLFHSFENN